MSFKTNFFRDTAIADNLTGGTEEQVFSSPAEAMAKAGYKNSNEEVADMPIIINSKKEEPKEEEEVATVETAKETTETKEVIQEAKQDVVEEQQKVEEAKKVEETFKAPTLQEVLKKEQPIAVFKELGYDDKTAKFISELKEYDPKVVGILEAYKEGKLNDYLKELSTDYATMSAEEVMRHQLRQEYPKASEKQLDILFRKEVVSAYNLNSDDDEEREEGLELLSAKADKYRDGLIKTQESYLLPKYTEKEVEQDNSIQLEENALNDFKIQINESPLTKQLIETNKLTFGDGEDKFSFPVQNTENLLNVLYDSQKWADGLFIVEKNKDGSDKLIPNIEKQLLIAAVHQDHVGFLKELGKQFKAKGGKSVVDDLENAKPKDVLITSSGENQPKSAAEAMAKGGTIVTGGR